jgi:hypothetical protein
MQEALWWQSGVIYQIYPRSIQDSNYDSMGELKGILQRLDHLAQVGVDAIWSSTISPSPIADCGYDVSTCCDVAQFATVAEFDCLVNGSRYSPTQNNSPFCAKSPGRSLSMVLRKATPRRIGNAYLRRDHDVEFGPAK